MSQPIIYAIGQAFEGNNIRVGSACRHEIESNSNGCDAPIESLEPWKGPTLSGQVAWLGYVGPG